ncbi:MAG: GTP-binding protein [Actinomycetota bacterium]|nr:GTP-binding protein [Actinomycetota bacterium]
MTGQGVRPLTVVSGALGSGKTTLLRRLLRQPGLRDTAVLVNEIGEVGLDHLQLRRIDEATVVLPGGCVCCATRNDVEAALRELLDGEAAGELPPSRRVVLETSGVADPAPVVATLLRSPVLRHHVAVDRVVVTVDAQAVTARPQQSPEWLQQVVCADVLALTKTDLVQEHALAPLRRRLAGLNPAAVLTTAAEVDLTVPVPSGGVAVRVPPMPSAEHLAGVASASASFDGPVDWAAFAVWLSALLHAHGDRVLRLKAVLDTGAGRLLVVDGVQHVVHPPRHLDEADGPRGSSVVVVTRDLDPQRVLTALRGFVHAG